MKSILQENDDITSNSKQLALLKEHFPSCFDKNGAFRADKLQEIVQNSGIELSKEGYSLNWLGKSYARLLAFQNVQTLLRADTQHNRLPENTNSQNLLIKGDNLEVLKHLMSGYANKVKMIYIDPPYNTGSDGFVYQDDRKFTVEQLRSLAGIDEDEAKRILEFTHSSSSSHSAWLTFMYPRLYLAKQLLRDDGVIFISIDDNEQAQLKILCDEVFGEENFIGCFVWKRRASSGMADNNVSTDHEYVLCYKKNAIDGFGGSTKNFKNYINPDDDPRGAWVSGDLTVGMSASMRPNQAYDLVDPETGNVFPCNQNRVWAYIPESMNKLIKEGRVLFPKDINKRPMFKRFKSELKTDCNPFSTIMIEKVGLNTEATKVIQELFGGSLFDYSKPLSLIKLLIQQTLQRDGITLDFFAGSGTTAHAVMQLNAEDGGNRQYICVQLDEPTSLKSEARKAGYQTVYEITAERIKRAAAKIQADYPEAKCDFGFKQFETIPVFEGYLDEYDELTPELEIFQAAKLSQEDRYNLMLTWQAQDGIPLTVDLVSLDLNGYPAYQGKHFVYFIEPNITLSAIVAFLEQLDNNPEFTASRLVLLGYLLDSKTQREISEAIKQYQNRKHIEITLEIRY